MDDIVDIKIHILSTRNHSQMVLEFMNEGSDTESFPVAVRGVSSFVADHRCSFGLQILGSCLHEDGEGGGVGVLRSDHQLCFGTSL